jgi:hypothetical protein
MADIERTSAGFQMILPGCERRTLPKSGSRSDDTGQGLLDFFNPPTAREELDLLVAAPLNGQTAAAKRSFKRAK